jgi:hypothetical protein
MIRPITCICFLLACGSGLYLYQAKHRVQVLDRQIEETVQATEKLREQTRVLHAEWTLMNDPQRLQALADQFLTLKTVQPSQFTSMADLDSRLPPVPPPEVTPPPAPAAAPPAPVAEATPPPPQPEQPSATVVATAPPPPPPPQAKPVAVAAAPPPPKPPEHKPAPPKPAIADARPIPRMVRPILAADVARPAIPQPSPFTGSALGMARTAVPLPQPMPVGAQRWVNNGNGGG